MTPENDYFAKTIKAAQTFFARWNGATAELWELRPYHRSLRVLVRRPNEEGNLLIACLEPFWVRGPISWFDCRLSVSTTTLPGGHELGFRVADDTANVEIITGAIEIKENVKLQ